MQQCVLFQKSEKLGRVGDGWLLRGKAAEIPVRVVAETGCEGWPVVWALMGRACGEPALSLLPGPARS